MTWVYAAGGALLILLGWIMGEIIFDAWRKK